MQETFRHLLTTLTAFMHVLVFLIFESFLFAIPAYLAYNVVSTSNLSLPYLDYFSCMAIIFLYKLLRFHIIDFAQNSNKVVIVPKKEDIN